LIVADLPTVYVSRLLRFVAAQTEESPHIEFCLLWIKALVDKHGAWLTANRGKMDIELRAVSRAVSKMRDEIRRLADENVYMVDYLLGQAKTTKDGKRAPSQLITQNGQKLDLIGTNDQVESEDASDDEEWIGLE
jgi:periodic tryptophan protein 2